MAVEKILKGTDVTMRTFQVKDSSGTLIPIADILDYNIYVYAIEDEGKVHQLTFRKTPVGDDKSIIVVDANTIGFVVDREYTANAPIGYLYAEIEVQITATSSYISSKQNVGNDEYIICEIIESSNPKALI